MIFRILILVLIAGGLTACLEKIDLEVPAGAEQGIVVQGSLVRTAAGTSIVVDVSRVFDFTVQSRQPVNVNQLVVIDNSGNELPLEQQSEGLYSAFLANDDPSFPIEFGNSYQVKLNTFDGRTIESIPETLVRVPQPTKLAVDTILVEVENSLGDFIPETRARFKLSTPLTPGSGDEKARLRWIVENTFRVTDSGIQPKTCYVTAETDIVNIRTFDGNEITDQALSEFSIFETPVDTRFAEGYYLTIHQQSLSRDAFRYFDQIKQSIDRTGNFFESPPGTILSNLKNTENPDDNVYGYFFVSEETPIRLFVNNIEVGSPDTLCPPMVPPPSRRWMCHTIVL